MPPPTQIVLTDEQDRTMSELRVATTVPQRTRDRAHMLRLNAQGWTVPAIAQGADAIMRIAKIFECHEHTIRATLRRWESNAWEVMGNAGKRYDRVVL
ncbi:helix-turn-helix domain-containing protein [Scytonema tolypothrichoides VB-61278]|nr:helix-turn-helix domain-containing protein [Scytonema tolypothrichoides VB-61278]